MLKLSAAISTVTKGCHEPKVRVFVFVFRHFREHVFHRKKTEGKKKIKRTTSVHFHHVHILRSCISGYLSQQMCKALHVKESQWSIQ